ncbi:8b13afad-1427-4a10-b3bc-d4cea8009edc [Sclerotinia trifoliorum]|uniref:8b13afad-1427-4a10-b3bc-d4cea8009edc n=1 Tax=Sclerotinia trifoliorum TaxID=28548 RepID=A0A8H2VSX5_9HELO|nr:8b13afad-1427-4a10-b3bc-d4cea8009edc [Sclerotinia trifoliorum]
MVVREDALRPSQADTQRMLVRSYHTWLSYTAKTNPQDGLQQDCFLLRNVLGRVPAFLANGFSKDCESPRLKLRHSESSSNNSALYINGWSTWCVSEGDCSLKEKIMHHHHQLLLGLQSSTRCCFADNSPFYDWPGVQGERKSPASDDDAARWWTAILANGEGWRATITRDSKVYRSPWSISLAATRSFKLRRTAHYQKSSAEIVMPPSSEQALRFLSDFCVLHNTRSQSSAALAATLTFPFLSNMTATLPTPPFSPAGLEAEIVFEEGKLLPYYMTLSCDCRGMQSLLCGSFFDTEVSCNLVSPWLEPIFSIIDPIVQRGDYGTLAMVMGKRQPKLASLWLGAIISGMAQIILPYVRNGLLSVELHACAWTSTTHSFINARPPTRCAIGNNEISRSDECRLLYLTEAEGHSRVPVCPRKPFGTTLLCDTEIEVRQHAKCSGHYLQYLEFTKISANSGDVVSEAWKDGELKSELLSELATRSIFEWLRVTGYPRCEQDIYRHSWIDLDLEESDEEELDDGISAGGTGSRDGFRDAANIHSWIDSARV